MHQFIISIYILAYGHCCCVGELWMMCYICQSDVCLRSRECDIVHISLSTSASALLFTCQSATYQLVTLLLLLLTAHTHICFTSEHEDLSALLIVFVCFRSQKWRITHRGVTVGWVMFLFGFLENFKFLYNVLFRIVFFDIEKNRRYFELTDV